MATKWSDRLNMFRSARLKLTLFYLGVLVLFNLTVTLSVRLYAEHEYLRSNTVQRGEFRQWVVRFFETDSMTRSEGVIRGIQDQQAQIVRDHLNQGLFVINMAALAIGGILSYWFAGRALHPIEEAHETQARFTADASHELRTPLANMRLENEVFLRQKHVTISEAREQIKSNLDDVQRLERLSNNLLALHQYGQAALTRSYAPVQSIVDQAINQIKASAEAKKVVVKTDIASANVIVHLESMVQLMDILLDNALKYGARGGEVLITGVEKSNRYILTVQDKGPGLAASDIPHLFDRLYRGDKARSTKVAGYGLGLALAREIAQANSVVIAASNNKDGGACFTLTMELGSRAPA